MIKYIIIALFFLGINNNIYTQDLDTCFSQQEILNITNKIKDLEEKNNIADTIITEQENQIQRLRNINEIDSLLIKNLERQIEFYKINEDSYKKLIEALEPKWWEDEKLWFVSGLAIGVFLAK